MGQLGVWEPLKGQKVEVINTPTMDLVVRPKALLATIMAIAALPHSLRLQTWKDGDDRYMELGLR